MKNIFLNIDKEYINTKIKDAISKEKVNNLRLFVTSNESKLSVTLSPDKKNYTSYHGLHPSFDEDMLKSFLEKNSVNDHLAFWKSIKNLQNGDISYMNLIFHKDFWSLNENNEKLLNLFSENKIPELNEILLGRSILHMASHFGFVLKFKDKSIKHSFENHVKDLLKNLLIDNKNSIYLKIEDEQVSFYGILPQEMIKSISLKYSFFVEDDILFIEESTSKNSLTELFSFKKEFLHHFRLIDCSVYYSGVMPRVMGIQLQDNYNVSKDIKPVIIDVSRTTYATVDFMDNPKILKHDFFDFYRKSQMLEFDNYEDNLQKKYLYDSSSEDEIKNLNKYLKYSLNTHTIAVSANIETQDGFLIMGKRGGKSIDAGEYYCSANGQSEFRDEDVSFYRESVFEDLPSMDYFSKYRVDLNQEIQRECIAELGVSQFKSDWKYYGISYLSINNFVDNKEITIEDSQEVDKRRMHFNVLAGNTTSFTFEEVVKGHMNATENFENIKITGIKTYLHKNMFTFLWNLFSNFIKWSNEKRSDILLIILFILSIFSKGFSSINNISIVEIIILSLYLILLFTEFINNRKINKLKNTKHFIVPKYLKSNLMIKNSYQLDIDSIFKDLKIKIKKEKNETTCFHAIFFIMYTLYFLDKNVEILESKVNKRK